MRRRRALILALLTGALVVTMALGLAWLQPDTGSVPQYP